MDEKIPEHMKIKTKQVMLPTSLRDLRDSARFNIDGYMVYKMDYLDLQALILNFMIENANKALYELKQSKMREKGIARIEQASEEDFNSL